MDTYTFLGGETKSTKSKYIYIYIPSPYMNPTHHRKLSAFYIFKKDHSV